jgi:3-hydroxy-9,10-secoandrosta-1,3,5(10)-triene-9,17-dione monooxygenase reductase component
VSVADNGGIHDEHPFVTPPEMRDPARRLRGRLPAPVTIFTAGTGRSRTGLTVSSAVVAEGDPPVVYSLIGPTTDFFDVMTDTGRFVIHVLAGEHRDLADVFAGIRPSPGGLFAGLEATDTDHGPLLAGVGTYGMCSVVSTGDESYSVLVAATLDRIATDELDDPLLYFRGAYRRLAD